MRDKLNVLGIVGSPRKNGNTDILVDEVLSGAQEAGAGIAKVKLSDLDIAPCRACGACHNTGICVQRDDMFKVLAQMQVAQVWVIGTPIYYWGPSAQLKTFVDRWYGSGKAVQFEGRRVILVIPLGSSDEYDARHTVGMLTDALEWQKTELVATIVATGVFELGAVRHHPALLAKARQAGRDVMK